METMAKLRALISSRIKLGVVLAFCAFQVAAAEHYHADPILIENCSVCLLGNNDPAVTTASLFLPKTVFLSDYFAILPIRDIVSFLAFDRLSRAPPLS